MGNNTQSKPGINPWINALFNKSKKIIRPVTKQVTYINIELCNNQVATSIVACSLNHC